MLRKSAHVVGEVSLTLGTIVLLFVLWQVWWSDIQANETASTVLDDVRADFAHSAPARGDSPRPPSGPEPREPSSPPHEDPVDPVDPDNVAGPANAEPATVSYGGAVAIIHLPTVGEQRAVMSGVGLDILDQGLVGHYPHTQSPGEIGTFAVAGHRTTSGRPFWALDDLQHGDPVVVETAEGWFVYSMERKRVVLPHQTEVLGPVPDQPAEEPTEAWMVMTACHPKFSAAERLIGYAKLDRFVPDEDGPPPELAGGA